MSTTGQRGTGDWTDERVETLKRLWAEGLSAAEIAEKMCCVSRNAVIGKIYRLGIFRNPGQREAAKTTARAYQIARNMKRRMLRAAKAGMTAERSASVSHVIPIKIIETPVIMEPVFPKVEGMPRALLELAPNQCKFPVGDPHGPQFHFCTGRKHDLSVYCEAHFLVAYSPPKTRASRAHREWPA